MVDQTDRFVNRQEANAIGGAPLLSNSYLLRLENLDPSDRRRWPRRKYIGRTPVWLLSEVRAWVAANVTDTPAVLAGPVAALKASHHKSIETQRQRRAEKRAAETVPA